MKKMKFEKKTIFKSNGQQNKTKQFIPIVTHDTHKRAREREKAKFKNRELSMTFSLVPF